MLCGWTWLNISINPTAVSLCPGALQNGTCMMVGGDAAWVELAGRLAAEQIGCAVHPLAPALARLAPPPGADPNPGEGDACIATRGLVLQIEAMARADYFVGTTTSAIPGVIQVSASLVQCSVHRCMHRTSKLHLLI